MHGFYYIPSYFVFCQLICVFASQLLKSLPCGVVRFCGFMLVLVYKKYNQLKPSHSNITVIKINLLIYRITVQYTAPVHTSRPFLLTQILLEKGAQTGSKNLRDIFIVKNNLVSQYCLFYGYKVAAHPPPPP